MPESEQSSGGRLGRILHRPTVLTSKLVRQVGTCHCRAAPTADGRSNRYFIRRAMYALAIVRTDPEQGCTLYCGGGELTGESTADTVNALLELRFQEVDFVTFLAAYLEHRGF